MAGVLENIYQTILLTTLSVPIEGDSHYYYIKVYHLQVHNPENPIPYHYLNPCYKLLPIVLTYSSDYLLIGGSIKINS